MQQNENLIQCHILKLKIYACNHQTSMRVLQEHTHREGLCSNVFLQLFLQNSVSILSVGVEREIFEYIKNIQTTQNMEVQFLFL